MQGEVIELKVPQGIKTIKTTKQFAHFIEQLLPCCQIEVDNDNQAIIYTGLDDQPHESCPDKDLLATYVPTDEEDWEEDE